MSEFTTNQLIKIILGIFVVVAVVLFIVGVFKWNILNFFEVFPIGSDDSSQNNYTPINNSFSNNSQQDNNTLQVNLIPIDIIP